MAFRDLTDVLGVSTPKRLPICGREVEFPSTISAWAGQLLLAIRHAAAEAAAAGSPASDMTELAMSGVAASEEDALRLERELLGDGGAVLDEMGVLGDARMRVVSTLIVWHLSGIEAAEVAWEGKAPTPNREARREVGRASRTAGSAKARSRTAAGASSARPATASHKTRS